MALQDGSILRFWASQFDNIIVVPARFVVFVIYGCKGLINFETYVMNPLELDVLF